MRPIMLSPRQHPADHQPHGHHDLYDKIDIRRHGGARSQEPLARRDIAHNPHIQTTCVTAFYSAIASINGKPRFVERGLSPPAIRAMPGARPSSIARTHLI